MARVIRPGFAFVVVSSVGFTIGLHTHRDKLMGYLIWLSAKNYDEMPTLQDARQTSDWRWCVFYALGAAINRKIDIPLGQIDVPPPLARFPRMRSGGGPQPWHEYDDGDFAGPGRECADPTLPIRSTVNDTKLKEMIVSGWEPSDRW